MKPLFEVPDHILFCLEEMKNELLQERLEVVLVPSQKEEYAKNGGMIRATYSRNPDWYRELVSLYPKKKQRKRKKPQSSLKRNDVLYAIDCLIRRKKGRSRFAEFLINTAKDRYIMYEGSLEPFNNQF